MKICATTTYFCFGNDFYEQVSGLAMGSPLSPILANLFMEGLERKLLSRSPCKPLCWFRYVDDTYTIWPKNRQDDAVHFLDFANRFHPSIKFTMESEINNTLPFLDTKITTTATQFLVTVHRKPTHSDSYLNYKSQHPKSMHKCVIQKP